MGAPRSQVVAIRATLLQGAYNEWDESVDGGISLDFDMNVDIVFRTGGGTLLAVFVAPCVVTCPRTPPILLHPLMLCLI